MYYDKPRTFGKGQAILNYGYYMVVTLKLYIDTTRNNYGSFGKVSEIIECRKWNELLGISQCMYKKIALLKTHAWRDKK